MLHTLQFQLLAGRIPVSVALFLLACNLLLITNCRNTACCSPPLNCSSAQLHALPDRGNKPQIATLEGLTSQQSHRNAWSSISSVLGVTESITRRTEVHRDQFSAPTLQGRLSAIYLFLENHVVVLRAVFKRSWQLAVNNNGDDKESFYVEAVLLH